VHEPGIGATIASVLAQGVQAVVVAVNNTDSQVTRLAAETVGDPRVRVVDLGAVPGRKAGALNRALAHVETDLVLVLDADTVLVRGWVRAALQQLDDPAVGAVGAVFSADSDAGWLRGCQAREWHRYAEEIDRTGRTFVLSGTAALIRTDVLRSVRYDEDSITEDFRLTVDLLEHGWKLRSPLACRSVTETMPTMADLFRQRRRWSLGAVQTVARVGWRPHTRVYWRQQAMLLLAVCSMSLFLTLTVLHGLSGNLGLSTVGSVAGLIFAAERTVTVWPMGWRHRMAAALLLPELAYTLILQAAHVAALLQFATGSSGQWHHVVPRKV
jgi:poly-beta-1,6-N-acetyl-D-glucosamine synthase